MFENEIAKLNRQTEENPPTYRKRTYTVSEVQDILGIGRNTAYSLVKRGLFSAVRVGGTIRISKKSFDAWLDKESPTCQAGLASGLGVGGRGGGTRR